MPQLRMEYLQKRVNDLFINLKEEANNRNNFLTSLEKILLIEKVLKIEKYKDFGKVAKSANRIARFEYQQKSLKKKIDDFIDMVRLVNGS